MRRIVLLSICLLALTAAVSLVSARESGQSRPRLPCNLPPYSLPDARDRGIFISPQWKPGQVIPVYFLNGSAEARGIVEHYAREWERFGNFRFQFHQERKTKKEEVAIVIEFAKQEGMVLGWSSVGSGTTGTDVPSMSLAPYGPDEWHNTPQALGDTVMHEFGHALGIKHEQDNPRGAPHWKREKAYEYFAGQGWSRAQIDALLGQQLPQGWRNTDFDPQSIMAYEISGENFVNGQPIGNVGILTAGDRAAIRVMYPGRSEPARTLPIRVYTDTRPMVLNFVAENAQITLIVNGTRHTIGPRVPGKKLEPVPLPTDPSRDIQIEWHMKPVNPAANFDVGIWNFPGGNGDKQENWQRCTYRDGRFLFNCLADASFVLVHFNRRNTGQVDDPNPQPQGDPNKLLLAAAASGDLAGVNAALNRGANINYSEGLFTALMYATQYNRIDVVKLLLQKGAINDRKSGVSPSRIAIYNGHTELMQILGPPEELSPEVRIRNMGP